MVNEPQETPAGQDAPQGKGDVFAELNLLGRKLGAAIESAWESPRRKEVTDELQEGLVEVTKQIDVAIKAARESKIGQDVQETTGKVLETAKQSKVLDEVRDGLLTGLREINTQLDKLIDRMHATAAQEPAAQPPYDSESAVAAEIVETPEAWPQEGLEGGDKPV